MNIKRNIIFNLESRKKKGISVIENLPIRIRIMYAGQRIDLPTGYRIDLSKWNKDLQRVKGNCTNKLQQNSSEINSYLDKQSAEIQSIFKEFEVLNILPTPQQFKDAYNKKQNKVTKSLQEDMFLGLFDHFIQECGSQNNWTTATIDKFKSIQNHLRKFDKHITFQSLSENRFNDYIKHLNDVENLRNSTVDKHIKDLMWFLRWATKKGYNQNLTFQDYKPKLKLVPKKVIFLSWEELTRLREYKLPKEKESFERVRDVFLFLCFTGLRYSDVYNLKRSDIKDKQIEVTTIKTTDSLIIELNSYSQSILDKYKKHHFEEDKALPVISNQKMNDHLKELGEYIGLDEPIRETYYIGNKRVDEVNLKHSLLSTHAGRRTFICNSLVMGIPAHTVMKWTGHSDYKAMKPYIDVSDKDKQLAMTIWDKKEEHETDKFIEQLKKIPKQQLAAILKGIA